MIMYCRLRKKHASKDVSRFLKNSCIKKNLEKGASKIEVS